MPQPPPTGLDRSSPGVRVERVGAAGVLVLDRPRALNALTLPMLQKMRAALDAWRHDDGVRAVVIESASDRAFCVGGDVRNIREAVLAGRVAEGRHFFAEEYALNRAIAEYPKPYVSLIDGLNLGGGLGVSVHGRVRVATERARFAMPETGIGFFPDIGASFFLSRLPRPLARFLGLTGLQINAADALHLGLATHTAPVEALAGIRAAICAGTPLAEALAAPPRVELAPGPLARHEKLVSAAFAHDNTADVLAVLRGRDEPFAAEAAHALAAACPLSLHVTDVLLAHGAGDDLPGCLARELAAAEFMAAAPDFAEGIRARLVDRDGAPRWSRGPALDTLTAEFDALIAAGHTSTPRGQRRGIPGAWP